MKRKRKEFIIDRLYQVWLRTTIKANDLNEAKAIFDKREETGDDRILREDFIVDSPQDILPGIFEQESEDGLWWSYNPVTMRFNHTYVIIPPSFVGKVRNIEGFEDNCFPFKADGFIDGSRLCVVRWLEQHVNEIDWGDTYKIY